MCFPKRAFLIFINMLCVIYLFVVSMCIFVPNIVDTYSGNHNAVNKQCIYQNCIIICYCTLDIVFPKIMDTELMSYANVTTKYVFVSIYNTIPLLSLHHVMLNNTIDFYYILIHIFKTLSVCFICLKCSV